MDSPTNQKLALGLAVLAVAGASSPATAQNVAHPQAPALPPPALHLELPLADVPFALSNGGSWPSMQQSLWVTTDLYQLMHHGLAQLVDPYSPNGGTRVWGKLLVTAVDLLTMSLPGLLAWHHEEWHRAVMSVRDIDSQNDVYQLNIFASTIAVSHVSDDDIIRLKAEHPADQVRMSTAGIEANYEGAHTLEKLTFFHDTRTWSTALLPLLYLQNWAYLATCASDDSDTLTDEERTKEGADVARRDFTGLDCNGWTYDLFRPDEPYQARGPHPSGVGIDRYRTYLEMSPDEQAYLRLQAKLALLNFLDPNIVGVNRIRLPWAVAGAPLDFNLAIRHLPTAFGYDVRADVFLKAAEALNLLVSLHGYFNRHGPLPGVEAQFYRLAAGRLAGQPLSVDLRASAWLQPKELRYDSNARRPGGLASVRVGWGRSSAFEPYLELEAKSEGWVIGNEFLDPNVSLRAGLIARLF